jgi:hypothetical protein
MPRGRPGGPPAVGTPGPPRRAGEPLPQRVQRGASDLANPTRNRTNDPLIVRSGRLAARHDGAHQTRELA